MGQRNHHNHMGFARGKPTKKIARAPECRGRQAQADKAQARVPEGCQGHRERLVAVG